MVTITFDWVDFMTVAMLVFALVMVLAGIFTAYFGSGKSRTVGVILFIVGLAIGIFWVWLTAYSGIEPFYVPAHTWDVFWVAFVNILAALIGALVAVGIFLVAVMKS